MTPGDHPHPARGARDGELVVGGRRHQGDDRLIVGESPDEADGHEVGHDGSGEVHLRASTPRCATTHLHHGDEPVAVAAERLVPLEGTLNFRDLGGYRTADGRQVRWGGVPLRRPRPAHGPGPHPPRPGVRLVCDFRDDYETQRAPSRLPDHPDLRMERFPIGAGGDTTVTGGRGRPHRPGARR